MSKKDRIDIEYDGDNGIKRAYFYGSWLVRNIRPDEEYDPAGTLYSVALTANEQYLVLKETPKNGTGYKVYPTFDDLTKDPYLPAEIKHSAADEIGNEYIEFLDI